MLTDVVSGIIYKFIIKLRLYWELGIFSSQYSLYGR